GSNSFTGPLSVQAGNLEVSGGSALADTTQVDLASGTQLLVSGNETIGALAGAGGVTVNNGFTLGLGGNNQNSSFGGVIGGAGGLDKVGSGALTLSGASTYGGGTSVSNGTLNVTGSLDSAVNVANGGTLTGSGSITDSVTVASGGALNASSGQQLTVDGLNMAAGAQLNVALGAPSTNALVRVNGDLALNGTLNVSALNDFGLGVYRLIDYSGALSGSGLSLGSLPAAVLGDLATIQSIGNGQVNLVLQDDDSLLQFWDAGADTLGGILGGSGTWGIGQTTWTNITGTTAGVWTSGFAVFGGLNSGTVNVVGNQTATGLQFTTDGYLLNGAGSIGTANGSSPLTVRVDSGLTATIDTQITGNGGLTKRDFGTLILGGNNDYLGDTTLSEGVLQVASDNNLGNGGDLLFNGGILRVTGTGFTGTSRDITWQAGGGGFDIVDAGNTFTLGQSLGGSGGLSKDGAGILQLNGASSYSGGTSLNAGSLVLGNDSAIGSGALNVTANSNLGAAGDRNLTNALVLNTGTTLNLTGDDFTLNGLISGAGALNRSGSGDLTLNHANTYAGGTTIGGGTLTLGSNTALGTGGLTIAGASNLDSASART
ncbi:beta strand repeat-containing protein, partial [Pseudomonas sp. Gutcm_11s]|uniref:beta strand repeat-containing protein n=1 Tax=Pseudomonas sp. Gutcm_11s TaxID=3026088 RepID=UPI00235E4033